MLETFEIILAIVALVLFIAGLIMFVYVVRAFAETWGKIYVENWKRSRYEKNEKEL